MFKEFTEIYHFIDEFKENDLKNLDKKISIIYRNYKKIVDINMLKKLQYFCTKNDRKFYLANNVKLAIFLNLDGAYIPSYNHDLRHNNYSLKKKFKIIGSAHNHKQIQIKEKQNVQKILLSPVFTMTNKKHMGIYRFLYLKNLTTKKIIALGGINYKNIKKLKMIKCSRFASISLISNIYRNK